MNKLNPDYPKHAGYKSGREFRKKKRADIKKVLNAMDELYLGCFYTPAYDQIKEARKHLELVQQLLTVKRWKR